MSEKTVPVLNGVATIADLNERAEFYFPTDGTRPPRQPATKFCQVDERTLETLITYAAAWRTYADSKSGAA